MNFFFDHQTYSLQEFGGISRYFSELIVGINHNTEHEAHLSAKYSNNVYAHDMKLIDNSFLPNTNFSKKISLLYKINKLYSTYEMISRPYNLIHATYYDPYFLKLARNRPTVVTFLDMIHERYSNQFTELSADRTIARRKELVAHNVSHIIAISESTKADVVNLLNVDPDKVSVIYLGSSFDNRDKIKYTDLNHEIVPYLLFVGNRGYYKNFKLFVTAVEPILKKYKMKVICAGGGTFTKEENIFLNTLGLTALVEHQDITDNKLVTLYQQATLFVFPSLYEGFGIPILEAFSCDCPCVLSNQSSLPEVGGDAAVYFDPTDASSMAESICKVIDSESLRKDLIIKGRERIRKFSWQKTVDETVNVYKNICR